MKDWTGPSLWPPSKHLFHGGASEAGPLPACLADGGHGTTGPGATIVSTGFPFPVAPHKLGCLSPLLLPALAATLCPSSIQSPVGIGIPDNDCYPSGTTPPSKWPLGFIPRLEERGRQQPTQKATFPQDPCTLASSAVSETPSDFVLSMVLF